MYTRLLAVLLLPLLALGQTTNSGGGNNNSASGTTAASANSSGSAAQSQSSLPASTTVVITSLSTGISFLPGRVQTTVVATQRITTVMPFPTASAAGSASTTASATSSSTTTTPSNLPTANPSVDGGGQNGAPSPGAKSPTNAYGPDDNYIAAATALAKNAVIVTIVGSIVGGAMILA